MCKMFEMKPKSTHRYRVCGTPVRTGCVTCKIRRVKCGEEKPFCKRCTSTGRKCDGYAPVTQTTTNSRKPPASETFPLELRDDVLENQMLEIFKTTTALKLSGYFSGDFWERRVQSSTSEPSIRHGVIAIAAIHKDYLSRHENFGMKQGTAIKAFAFRQYTKAISHLHQLMSSPRTGELDLTLMSCILFICFDCISGNHDRAIIHLKAGLKILEDFRKRNRQTELFTQANSTHEWEREFVPLLLSLGVHAASFYKQRNSKDQSALWMMMKEARHPTQPTVFHTIDDARLALDTRIVDIMVNRTLTGHPALNMPSYGEEHRRQAESMQTWKEALDRYLATYTATQSPTTKVQNGATVLKINWLVVCIVKDIPIALEGKFEEVISLCKSLMSTCENGTYAVADINFSTDIGIIGPLVFTALKAPNMYLRRQAQELLSRSPRVEGMWDAYDAVAISSQAIADREELRDRAVADFCTPVEQKMWNNISASSQGHFTAPIPPRHDPEDVSLFTYEDSFSNSYFMGSGHAFAHP